MRNISATIAVAIASLLVLAGLATAASGVETTPEAQASTARIGLFLAGDPSPVADATELRRGAELAAAECGGAEACRLVVAAGAGHWSAGAGELVRLVYTSGVRAVLGPADTRTAHLAEQVAARAKGRFLLLTPWVSDPALTRIKVPWFFRLVPDDRQQAEALLGEIERTATPPRIMLVTAREHPDFRPAAEAFERAAAACGTVKLDVFPLRENTVDIDRLAPALRSARATAVVFLAPPDAAAAAVRDLRAAGITIPFFGPLRLASPAFLDAAGAAAEGMVLAAPPEPAGPTAERFHSRYQSAYGGAPSTAAYFGYDAAAVLMAALRSTRADDSESGAAALTAIRHDGLTGPIQFDASGNRTGPIRLARVEKGHLRAVSRGRHGPGVFMVDQLSTR